MHESRPGCGALLLRAWSDTGDPAELRVRLLVADPLVQRGSAYAVGVDKVCEVIREWLVGLTIGEGSHETPP